MLYHSLHSHILQQNAPGFGVGLGLLYQVLRLGLVYFTGIMPFSSVEMGDGMRDEVGPYS